MRAAPRGIKIIKLEKLVLVKGYHPPPEPLPASENSQDFCAGAVPPDRGGGRCPLMESDIC